MTGNEIICAHPEPWAAEGWEGLTAVNFVRCSFCHVTWKNDGEPPRVVLARIE